MLRFVIKSLLFMLALWLVFSTILKLNPYFDQNYFYKAVEAKYEKLKKAESPKIIVLSGSSAAYGINSVQMEAQLGIPVINMGISHLMGTKFMLEYSKAEINEGDIVIYAREYIDSRPETHYGLIGEYAPIALAATPSKTSIFLTDYDFFKTAANGVYQSIKKAWVDYPKEDRYHHYDQRFIADNNKTSWIVENRHTKETYKKTMPLPDSSWIEVQDLKKFKEYIEGRKAKLFLSPPGACEKGFNKPVMTDYIEKMSGLTTIPILNNRKFSTIPSKYIHDSEYHPTYLGRYIRTKKLTEDIINHGLIKRNESLANIPSYLNLMPKNGKLESKGYTIVDSSQMRSFNILETDVKTDNFIRSRFDNVDFSNCYYALRIRCSEKVAKLMKCRLNVSADFDLINEIEKSEYFLVKHFDAKVEPSETSFFGVYLKDNRLLGGESIEILEEGIYMDPGDITLLNVDTSQYRNLAEKELVLKKATLDLPTYLTRLKSFEGKTIMMTIRGDTLIQLAAIEDLMKSYGSSLFPLDKKVKSYSAVFTTENKFHYEDANEKNNKRLFKGNTAIKPFKRVEIRNGTNGLIKIDNTLYTKVEPALTVVVFDNETGRVFDTFSAKLQGNPYLNIDRIWY